MIHIHTSSNITIYTYQALLSYRKLGSLQLYTVGGLCTSSGDEIWQDTSSISSIKKYMSYCQHYSETILLACPFHTVSINGDPAARYTLSTKFNIEVIISCHYISIPHHCV